MTHRSSVDAFPTKQFFMNMLTRDIDLKDAILDLLDNCLDGVLRAKRSSQEELPLIYEGYWANIIISNDKFSITDNCGGIERSIAEQYAFRMGRADTQSEELETVGIYGIGMKRAIFKMGKKANVKTKNGEDSYQVIINPNWETEKSWAFPVEELPTDALKSDGTSITVENLNPDIKYAWNEANLQGFVEDLIKTIQRHYMLILNKGFKVTVNGKSIKPESINLLFQTTQENAALRPFIYEKEYKNERVSVFLMIGFYSRKQTEQDADDQAELIRTSDLAGWTVICNDRVILYNDKTHRTGWGEAGVPQYHTQFIGIRGVVQFRSRNPQYLPMSTTKRDVDLTSPIYADIKNKMREGLKQFTAYTNKWKGLLQEEENAIKGSEIVSFSRIIDQQFQRNNKTQFKDRDGGKIYKPTLPKPKDNDAQVLIQYRRPKTEVDLLKSYLNEDESIPMSNSEVGIKSFQFTLEIKKQENI